MNRTQPFIVVMCIHLNGELSCETLDNALEIVRKRHYYLSFSIQENDHAPEFVADCNARIPIKVIEAATDTRWIEEGNKEINEPFSTLNAPLAKVILLRKKNETDIILKISHIITDGISAFHFIRDLLSSIDGLERGLEIKFPNDLQDIFPDTKLFPETINTNNNSHSKIAELPASLLNRLNYFPLEKRSTGIIPHCLNTIQSKFVIDKCREEKTTVNALLAASLVINLKNYIQNTYGTNEEYAIKSSSGLNLRNYYNHNIKSEQMGSWAGIGYVYFDSKEISSIWECARMFNKRLCDFIDQGKPFSHLSRLIDTYSQNSTEATARYESKIPYALLTNIGKLDLPERYGNNLQLKKISLFTAMHRNWINDLGFGLCATTFNNQINLIFHYMKPARTESEAKDFVKQVLNLIFEDQPDLLD